MRLSRRARILIVAALIVYANALSLPDVGRIFAVGLAEYGFATDHSVITKITSGMAADQAGLKLGDHIEAQALRSRVTALEKMVALSVPLSP